MSTAPHDKDELVQPPAGDGERYQVDARGAEGLLVGDQGTQINYFYKGTLTDGVAPPPLVTMSGTITSPYRGLNAFEERDAALFFGREAAATQVLELMSRCLEGTGLVVVSGVSGAGKSSLLRAGVLPRLRGAGLGSAPEAASWPRLVFAPGPEPLKELAVRVAPVAGAVGTAVLPGLAADPAGFALTARQAALARLGTPAPGGDLTGQRRVLLVVDQFEQLFTQCKKENERQEFITALHAAAATPGGERRLPAALVVVLVRADFEARLADYPLLAPSVQDRYLLSAMTKRQLRMAITEPAVAAGSSVDDDLVQVLLEEVRTRSGSSPAGSGQAAIGAGVLPLLSHALDQAWRGRTSRTLTLADYERTGGIEGAVAASAQRAYDQLTPAQQAVARQVFTRLTATTSDGVDTAARAARAELTAGQDEAHVRDVEAVLETFTAERLLTLAAGTVEISHETLLTAWPLLHDTWLADTRTDRVIRTRLHATAEEWNRANRDPSYLYSGSRLEIATETAARIGSDARQTPLGVAEQDFLRASRRTATRRARRRQGYTAILLALLAGLAAVAFTAVRASQTATRASQAATQQRDAAISGELASESEATGDANATVSRLESIAAWAIDPSSAQARYAMLRAAASHEIVTLTPGSGLVNSVAFSPDGTILAIGGDDGTAKLWNVATGRQTSIKTDYGPVDSVAFSPDGTMLATGDDGGTTELWNVATRRQTGTLNTSSEPVDSVTFSPDGTKLAIGDYDGTAKLWNVATGKQIRSLGTGHQPVKSVAFSKDGTTLATGYGDGTAKLWSVATGKQIRSLNTSSGQVNSVAFSPDGTTLATGDFDGTAKLWNVATARQTGTLDTGPGQVKSVAFSKDGTMLATGDDNGTALWNLATGSQVGNLAADLGPVNSVAFSPRGETLATGDNDGTVRLWDASGGQVRGLSTSSADVDSVAFSLNGTRLATGGSMYGVNGTAELWNVATGRQIRSLDTGAADVDSVAFSPDGTTLATGEDDGTAKLWNVATGHQIRSLNTSSDYVISPTFSSDGGSVPSIPDGNSVAFSPDGTMLATGDGDGTAKLWNVASGHQIRSLNTGSDQVESVTFSKDGTTLATGNGDGTAKLWNVATGHQIRSLNTSSEPVDSVTFSPDGTTLAIGDFDGTAKLWNVATGHQTSLNTGSGQINSMAFSPDGTTLATGDEDGTIQLYDPATGQQISSLDSGSGQVKSVAFSPDGTTLAASYSLDTGDRGVIMWSTSDLADTLTRLCSQVGGSLTPAEWARYVPSGPSYRDVCNHASKT